MSLELLQVQVILDGFPSLRREQIIVRDAAQYADQLKSALQSIDREGFDIVLDAISGEYFQPSYDAMARGGRHVIFGAANWTPSGYILLPNSTSLLNTADAVLLNISRTASALPGTLHRLSTCHVACRPVFS